MSTMKSGAGSSPERVSRKYVMNVSRSTVGEFTPDTGFPAPDASEKKF
jgi:hypothetical protein